MSTAKVALVRSRLEEWHVDGVLVSADLNRRWLTGFTGSFGYVLITAKRAILATDGRYWTQVGIESPDFELYKYERKAGAMKTFLESAEIKTLGVEADHVTLAEFATMEKADSLTFRKLRNIIEPLRLVKSADEIAAIRAAAAITDYAMAQVNEIAQVGMSERALAWELERTMRERGADKMAFDIIVASGPNSAKPHHRPSDRKMQEGDTIIIDMGAMLNGYHSDLTHTFHLGSNPSDKFWEIYTLVQDAHDASMENLRPGMTSVEADATSRDVIAAAGYAEEFMHSLGHGVGLEIHEGPRMSRFGGDEIVPEGTIITVEPGVYIEGWGGVRIEDLGILTPNGVEPISKCPRTPIIQTM